MRQCVSEGVLEVGEEAGFVEEFGRLQMGQAAMKRGLGQLDDRLKESERNAGADDGGGL